MSKIKNQWSFKEFVRLLKNNGYHFKRNTQGSHQIYTNGRNNISVSFTDLNPMLVRRMIKVNNLKV